MNKRNSFLVCLGITAAFWALHFFGPALIMLWNNVSYWLSGLGYGENSLMYKVLNFLAQPIACILAYGAAGTISRDEHNICVLVNFVIAACLFVLFVIMYFFAGDTSKIFNNAASAAVCIGCAIHVSRTLKEEKQNV